MHREELASEFSALIDSREDFADNWDAGTTEELSEEPETTNNNTRRSLVWLQTLAFLLGLGLLIYVINRVGVQPLFDALLRIGFGFFVVLGLSGLRHVLRTISMRAAVPPEHRRISFRHAFAARLGGEAISFLTFTGPLLGEATKVALLRKRVPLTYGVPALVVDNLIYNLSVVFFVLSGAVVMLLRYPLPPGVYLILLVIAAVAASGILVAAIAAKRRVMLLTWIIDRTAELRLSPKVILKKRHHIYHLESKVYDFYKHHPGAFFLMILCNLLAHAASVVEVFVTLRMLGFQPQVAQAYIIESLTKVINFVFAFVPGTIGVYEGGTEVILQKGLGFTPAAGLALALVRKAAIVVWTSIGLLVLTWRTLPNAWRRIMDRSPRLQRLMDSLVLSNIAHRPARTAVSILGTGVGVLLIVFTVGLAHGILHERGRRESNIGAEIMIRSSGTIGLGGSQFKLPASHVAELAAIPGVRAATPIGQTFDKSDTGFGQRLIDGIEYDQYAAIARITMREGRKLESGDEAIIDGEWQRTRKANIGDTVKLFERPFKIVGVYEPPGGGRIKIPLKTMQDQEGAENKASAILVACASPEQQDEVAARILERFPEDQLIFTRDLPEIYASGVPALNVFIKVVVGVASAISVLVILLAMYTTVTERTRQIGILKSLGMSKTAIAWVIEQEAIIVSVLGVVVGVLLTMLAKFAVMRTTSLTIDIEPRWVLIALAVGLVGGTIGALYPALRAARQDAVEALSYE
ncbi:MAG TPA: lysylphosphatidylglycerol synthase domain-containing protein [Pyrinomonadaceae bacterium]|nr:lysylphosphatidylglycerol synthase domain-containing protein [Pyrinomonadaceae bacterium]